jgi:hypothetical protein
VKGCRREGCIFLGAEEVKRKDAKRQRPQRNRVSDGDWKRVGKTVKEDRLEKGWRDE